uniref:Uncharacterized protein n=1 Tax=Molossus molossus TaxID=27622 RepID=A0A7J8HHA4_MOLMO|nr:hypothetical protein HJG59_011045 [Molossus molossus]
MEDMFVSLALSWGHTTPMRYCQYQGQKVSAYENPLEYSYPKIKHFPPVPNKLKRHIGKPECSQLSGTVQQSVRPGTGPVARQAEVLCPCTPELPKEETFGNSLEQLGLTHTFLSPTPKNVLNIASSRVPIPASLDLDYGHGKFLLS